MQVEVVLVVIGSKPERRLESQVLLVKEDEVSLPRTILSNCHTTKQAAANLLHRYTGLHAMMNGVGWVPLVQKPVIDNPDRIEYGERCIAIPFTTLIPDLIPPLFGAQWFKIGCQIYLYKDHLQIIDKVLRGG